MPKQRMTAKRLELLEEIKREQIWAEAHQANRDMYPEGSPSAKFHNYHRDMALHERDRLLSTAPQIVKTAFAQYVMTLHNDPAAPELSIQEVDRKRLTTWSELNEILEARKVNWRNYRSRSSHAF